MPGPHAHDVPPSAADACVVELIGSLDSGGSARVASSLVCALRTAGVRAVGVSCFDAQNATQGDFVALGSRSSTSGPLGHIKLALRLREALRHERATVVHVHGERVLLLCWLALLGLRARPKLWFTWHNPEKDALDGARKRPLLRFVMRRCDRVFGASSEIVGQLTEGGLSRRPAVVFVNGVENSPSSAHLGDDVPTILWMARVVPTKDLHILLNAAGRLKAEGMRFRILVAGNAPANLQWYHDEAVALVARHDLQSEVTFLGWIADVAPLVQSASIGVQTSWTEGLSITLLEQMTAGLAIVATDVGDTRRAIESGVTGLLVPPGNEQALLDALRTMIRDPAQRMRMGLAARTRAESSFSLPAMARQVVENLD